MVGREDSQLWGKLSVLPAERSIVQMMSWLLRHGIIHTPRGSTEVIAPESNWIRWRLLVSRRERL